MSLEKCHKVKSLVKYACVDKLILINVFLFLNSNYDPGGVRLPGLLEVLMIILSRNDMLGLSFPFPLSFQNLLHQILLKSVKGLKEFRKNFDLNIRFLVIVHFY